ncbi:MAG: alkaline phosphatase family protein [Actinomycetota bacterium]|nr:alkaline phosphatase family protein [Actinomycetota bacterium]
MPDETRASCEGLGAQVTRVARGYVPSLSPDISVIPREPNYVGPPTMPVHSGPWDYLARVPLVLYGPGHIAPGTYDGPATMADLAPTSARLIDFDGFRAPDGRILDEALKGRSEPPRIVVTVVWDGGGWNVLRSHPKAWPFLKRLMDRSATWPNMTIGSSPSVTPPIHTTLGSGAWPRRHGIPALNIRTAQGEFVDPMLFLDPSRIRVPTLADVYDEARSNAPVVGLLASSNWHLGMVGHGAGLQGGDRDEVVILREDGSLETNPEVYSLPAISDTARLEEYTRTLDTSDGQSDGAWRGHPLDDPLVRYSTPAHVQYQEFLLEAMLTAGDYGRNADPDLLFVNFKSGDDAGHRWGMTSAETGATLRAIDAALARLIRFLDAEFGRDAYVMMLTADHGQTPYPEESGGWPVAGGQLKDDVNAEFDHSDNGVDLVDRVVSAGLYVRPDELDDGDASLEDIADWVVGYSARENLVEDESLPEGWGGRGSEPLFDAVLVGRKVAGRSCAAG